MDLSISELAKRNDRFFVIGGKNTILSAFDYCVITITFRFCVNFCDFEQVSQWSRHEFHGKLIVIPLRTRSDSITTQNFSARFFNMLKISLQMIANPLRIFANDCELNATPLRQCDSTFCNL